MPRAADAYATADKWGWILGARGHGTEWARIFKAEPEDSGQIWHAIAAAVLDARVSTVRDRAPHGVVGGVELTLTINDREAAVATAWHTPTKTLHHASLPPTPPRNMTSWP
jgi:hypothetical protein